MLKRFLKFLHKGASDQPIHEEGAKDEVRSYLDRILDEIFPQVLVELDRCPAHDPLQLAIVEILRTSMPGVWSDRLRRPLTDPSLQAEPASPPTVAPPPPPGAEPSEDDVEILDEELVDDEEVVRLGEAGADADNTNELELSRDLVDEEQLEEDEAPDDDRPRVDDEEVLQAGRVYLAMLIENDRLPLDLQLSAQEADMARELLLGYFAGAGDFEARAKTLLEKIEQKFGKGYFSQARILLQLFQTDRTTRVNNDRNIFYEDMILRLGIRRKHPLAATLHEETEQRLQACVAELGVCEEHLAWMSEHLFIKFHLFSRDPDEVARWREATSLSTRPGATEHLLRYLPPRRWRPTGRFGDLGLAEVLRDHVSRETARRYVTNQIKTCYFVLRAVGDTGLEGYLDTFFDWSEERFGVNGTTALPRIYRRVMSEDEPVQTIFSDVYDEHYRRRVDALVEKLTTEDLDQALVAALEALMNSNFDDVAPGNYDLGGLIFDRLFGIDYPTPEFAFKLHRLT